MAWSHPTISPFPGEIDREAFGHWLSGFIDGEGSFGLVWARKPRRPVGIADFTINLRHDDQPILKQIQSFWACGRIWYTEQRARYTNECPQSQFRVRNLHEMAEIVIPHFDRFPLRAKKARDFAVWREAVDLLYRIKKRRRRMCRDRRHGGRLASWTEEDIARFSELHDAIREVRRYGSPEDPPVLVARIPATGEQKRMW